MILQALDVGYGRRCPSLCTESQFDQTRPKVRSASIHSHWPVIVLLGLLSLIVLLVTGSVLAQEKHITIAYPGRDFNNLAPIVAETKGFFREVGISPTFTQMRSNVALTALIGGSVDYYGGFSSAILSATRGAPMVGILVVIERPNFYLISRPEIRTVADLRGKVLGVGALKDSNDIISRKLLAHFHMTPDKDVTIRAIGDLPVRMAAMNANVIQATTAPPPAPILAKQMGFPILAFAGDIMDLPLSGLSTSNAKIKAARNEVVSVISAVLRGLLFMRSNRQETLAIMQHWLKMDEATAQATYDSSIRSLSMDGTCSLQGIQAWIDEAWQQGSRRQILPTEAVDFGPLREVQKALNIR